MVELNQTADKHSLLVWGKGQLNSEWIYDFIVSPKVPTKNYKYFYQGSLLEGKEEIFVIFGLHFGRNDEIINSFWINWPLLGHKW